MRRRIRLVVAATTSAVILSFVIPLCLLVQTLAEDRALASARDEAQTIAIFVSSLSDANALAEAIRLTDVDETHLSAVLLPDGQVVGRGGESMPTDPLVARAAEDNTAFTQRTDTGASVLVPIVGDDGTTVIRTTVTSDAMHKGVGQAWATIVGVGILLLLAALAVAHRLGERISTPVTKLAEVAHRLREGELEARAEPNGPPEAVELGHALNQLADRIGELLVAEREVAADLSHRLRTPVTALRLDAETVTDPDTAERLREHIDHLQRTVDAVVAEARRPVRGALRGNSAARAVVMDRVRFWQPLAEDQARKVTVFTTTDEVMVGVATDDLRDMLDNLIDNVFAHTPEGTPWGIELQRQGDTAFLTVFDSGPGLGDLTLTRRGSSGSGSTGLGLDIVRRIARSAGGELTVSTRPDGGAEFRVSMPVLPPPRPPVSEGRARLRSQQNR
jgi:signal transduction histidine kinase